MSIIPLSIISLRHESCIPEIVHNSDGGEEIARFGSRIGVRVEWWGRGTSDLDFDDMYPFDSGIASSR